jgi:hypothetical protein
VEKLIENIETIEKSIDPRANSMKTIEKSMNILG